MVGAMGAVGAVGAVAGATSADAWMRTRSLLTALRFCFRTFSPLETILCPI